MKIINFKIHVAYSFLFLFIFFTGFDNAIIWQRTFIETKSYTLIDYFHYYGSIVGGWILGVLVFKRMITKYPLDFMLNSSLIMAAFATWSQFRIISQATNDLFTFNVFLNLIFNIAMGFLVYSLKQILATRSELHYALKTNLIILVCIVLSLILSMIFVQNNLHYYFLITSLVYLAGHYFFRLFELSNLRVLKDASPYAGIATAIIFLFLFVAIVQSKYIQKVDFIFDDAGYILVFVFVLLTFKPTIGKAILFTFLSIVFGLAKIY